VKPCRLSRKEITVSEKVASKGKKLTDTMSLPNRRKREVRRWCGDSKLQKGKITVKKKISGWSDEGVRSGV